MSGRDGREGDSVERTEGGVALGPGHVADEGEAQREGDSEGRSRAESCDSGQRAWMVQESEKDMNEWKVPETAMTASLMNITAKIIHRPIQVSTLAVQVTFVMDLHETK